LYDSTIYKQLKEVQGVKQVQVFATKPGIIESEESMQGVIVKGVSADYDWSFIADALKEGRILSADDTVSFIVVSSYIADRMKLAVGDKARMMFFDSQGDNHRQRSFRVCGIYETGLEDFDKQMVFADLNDVQRLYGWGLRVGLNADSVAVNDSVSVYALASGGDGELAFQWSDSTWQGPGPHKMHVMGDTSVQLVVSDLSDTKQAKATASWQAMPPSTGQFHVETTIRNSDTDYIGGYEVNIQNYDDLW
jgi:hypothetical protein